MLTENSHSARLFKTARGFTLIELMIAVVIIGILAAIIAPNVIGRLNDAKVSAAKQDVATLVQTLTMYKLDNSRFPSGEQGLKALVEKPSIAPLPNMAGWFSYES